MANKDMLRFKKRLKEGERLSKKPRNKTEECARWGCLVPMGLIFILFIVTFYQAENKKTARGFCRATEQDAYVIAATLADYFAIPTHTSIGPLPIVIGPEPTTRNGIAFPALSGNNQGTISGDLSKIIISVPDSSDRCLMSYQERNSDWSRVDGKGVFTKVLN